MLCRAHNKNKKIKSISFTWRVLSLACLILVGLSYVWHISQVSTQGYYLKELERKISLLQQQNEKLSFTAAELTALSRIDSETKRLGLVKNDEVIYLTSGLEVVARNK